MRLFLDGGLRLAELANLTVDDLDFAQDVALVAGKGGRFRACPFGPKTGLCAYTPNMASLRDIVFDCRRPAALGRFWAGALGGYEVAPYDEEELERLRRNGIDDPEDDPSVLVEPTDPAQPRLFFNRVPEPKATKNRVHLDLAVADVEAETRRLCALGATEVARVEDWITLTDPEGNEFDLLPRD